MPLEQSEAFILRTFNIGEQDKIVTFFSSDKGVIKGIANGARKFGNRFGSSLEPLSHVKVYYYEKEQKDLVTISNCDLLESFFEIQKDLKTTFALSYFIELIEGFSPTRSKDSVLFRLLLSTLNALKGGGNLDLLSVYFETWFLKIGGVLPDFKKCKKCRAPITASAWLGPKRDGIICKKCVLQKKEEIKIEMIPLLQWIKKNPPPTDHTLPCSPQELKDTREILQQIVVYHLEKEPKNLKYLK
ncbi:DNA repair protein RecO [Acidobacteriota bacterium]